MDDLIQAYRDGKLMLFVGAGISMNLGLPSWRKLIDHMAEELGYDPDVYQSYGDSYWTLAQYYRHEKGGIEGLCRWMDEQWHHGSIDIGKSKVHELIVKSDFDRVYTTNYDRWLERAFKHYGRECVKISGVGDLATAPNGIAQIVKFHGDFDDPKLIVLDETSYFERFSFESPLDIKFRSDVLGRSVLFIGYSLSDINVRYLFYRLSNLWKNHAGGIPQPQSHSKRSAVGLEYRNDSGCGG